MKMAVSFCLVAWARLSDLLSALHTFVFSTGGPHQWPLQEAFQVQTEKKKKTTSGLGEGEGWNRSSSPPHTHGTCVPSVV